MIEIKREPFKRSDRCVHCGRPESVHLNGCVGSAGSSGQAFGSLNLPDGKTCGDCVHIERCNAIFGHIPADQTCDWFPIRFRERV